MAETEGSALFPSINPDGGQYRVGESMSRVGRRQVIKEAAKRPSDLAGVLFTEPLTLMSRSVELAAGVNAAASRAFSFISSPGRGELLLKR